jgi:hypothetical protein
MNLTGSTAPAGSPSPAGQLDDAKVATHARKLMDADPSLGLAAAVRQAEADLVAKGGVA